MCSPARKWRRLKPSPSIPQSMWRATALTVATLFAVSADTSAQQTADRAAVLDAMKRATTFMVEKVAYRGGYVWNYLPDMTRRWGEMEARPTMIWIQPPGTPVMGHLLLDAFHATGDDYYYRAAEQVASALAAAQHPSGGWNYLHDFAGEKSLRAWYDTVGKNAWRLEEFQHYYGNAGEDRYEQANVKYFSCSSIGFKDHFVQSCFPCLTFYTHIYMLALPDRSNKCSSNQSHHKSE